MHRAAPCRNVPVTFTLDSMLSAVQRENLLRRADSVASSVQKALTYLHVLKGIEEGSAWAPENSLAYPFALDAIRLAASDALYAAVGTVVDSRRDVESFHTLATMARHYFSDPVVRRELDTILNQNTWKSGALLMRVEAWRNKYTAHRTLEVARPEFYVSNKLELSDLEAIVTDLDKTLSRMTELLLGFTYQLRRRPEIVQSNCASLVAGYAV